MQKISENEVKNKVENSSSLHDYLEKTFIKYADMQAITDDYNNINQTYKELKDSIDVFAGGLQALGVSKGDFVCLFSENNGRWVNIDQAILKCGAIDVLRGSTAPVEDLDYIIEHSEAKFVVFMNDTVFNKMKSFLNKFNLKFAIIMFSSEERDSSDINFPVFSFEDVMDLGKKNPYKHVEVTQDNPCTMLYTSGTLGRPKGVLLTHQNVLSQMPGAHSGFLAQPGENTLQILPIWHAYERTAQFYYLSSACHLHFTTLSGLKNDLLKYKIDTFMSVPRIWEALRLAIYQKLKQNSKIGYYIFDKAVKLSITYKIHKMYSERRITNKQTRYKFLSRVYHKLARIFLKPLHILFGKTVYKKLKNAAGLNFRVSISGGGALSMKDELFYDAIGVNLRIGYGLTETSPVVTLRGVQSMNFLGSVGNPIIGTEVKIIDPNTLEELPHFKQGVVHVKGPQVMSGYYKDEEATDAVLSKDGWFNTGDLGWLTHDNNLVLVGRMKETIVLSSGENVEPVPIEEAILESPYIGQIVLVGQDESSVGALIVPTKEALEKCGILANELKSGKNLIIKDTTLRELIKHELTSHLKNKKGLKAFERVKQFEILKDEFSIDNGLLSQTMKVKRNSIFTKYKDLITKMFNK